MIYFIPAWYQQNKWCENEQNWHARRMHTEFDDTVKHIQLFHRSGAYPFRIILLSYAPNLRHFLHRQSVFHAPYWSCFDAIQEIKRKKAATLSFHNLNWPSNIEFVYSPFVIIALLNGEKYAQIEFGEDGNMIEITMYATGVVQRRNIYDDRGFVSSTIIYENGKAEYQDYLTDKGIWKIRHYFQDDHVEVNPKANTYLLSFEEQQYVRNFKKQTYCSLEAVIMEVLSAYVEYSDVHDLFCIAMHSLHASSLGRVLSNKKKILSFYENRYDMNYHIDNKDMILQADYIIADSNENIMNINSSLGCDLSNIIDITPFDSRVDFGISQQLSVQNILVPVDGLGDKRFDEVIYTLGKYLPENDNVRVHLFTRYADYDRKKIILERTREVLRNNNMEEDWATEVSIGNKAENKIDDVDEVPVRFYVDQCVNELAVSKCLREQRLIVDMRMYTDVFLNISGISVGIPQINYIETQFVSHGGNGYIVKDMNDLPYYLSYYLDGLKNWNEAMVFSYELGKKYTSQKLIGKWKEVINIVRDN